MMFSFNFLGLWFCCLLKLLQKSSKKGPEYWLLWKYEGESTLAGLLQSKEFPYNVCDFFSWLFILLQSSPMWCHILRQWYRWKLSSLGKFKTCLKGWKEKTKLFRLSWDNSCLHWMVFTQLGLSIGMLSLRTLFSQKVNHLSSRTFSSGEPNEKMRTHVLCPLKLEQVLVLSRLLILELQLIWEWELTTFQKSFSWIQGLFLFKICIFLCQGS